jgi:hypothetical protein
LFATAGNPPPSAAVKKLAEVLGEATIKGDFAKVIDHTYEPLVKELGGRVAAIMKIETAMKQLGDQGIAIKAYKIGTPVEFLTEGANTFIVVPTAMEMTFPAGRANMKSYLLGISPDAGKTWKFADGAGLSNKSLRDRLLPKLPAKLKLPEIQQPEITKDK